MTLNGGSRQAIIDRRRQTVASLRLRGLTQREIVDALEQSGVVNPDTGKPWSLGTVNYDLNAVRKQWREQATADLGEHIAQRLAELEAVKRKAWANNLLPVVLQAIDRECKLLGLNAPEKVEHSGDPAHPIEIAITEVVVERPRGETVDEEQRASQVEPSSGAG